MSNRSRIKVKGRKDTRTFIAFPLHCLKHDNFIVLSPYARMLLIDLYMQYNGFNNGDFCCTWSIMKKRRWRSQATLNKAKKELIYYGWIICSRHGGKNRCSLYAVTFKAIDECKGKLEIPETVTAPGTWKNHKKNTWEEYLKIKNLGLNKEQITTATVVKKGNSSYHLH